LDKDYCKVAAKVDNMSGLDVISFLGVFPRHHICHSKQSIETEVFSSIVVGYGAARISLDN
jgi:hypothetical protein